MSVSEKYRTREEISNVHPFQSRNWLVHNGSGDPHELCIVLGTVETLRVYSFW